MNKFSFLATLLFGVLSFYSANLTAQTHNAYKFIEPNISVSYDSNYFKIEKRYSNTNYETEAYDFSFFFDTTKKTTIYIKADHPIEYPPRRVSDSLILKGLEEIERTQKKPFTIKNIDQHVRDINGFSCVGIVGYDKKNNEYATIISCYHFSDNDNTEVKLISNGSDLENEYKTLVNFLRGFKSYPIKEIEAEENTIKNKYTVLITPAEAVIDNFEYRPKTYLGIVSIKEPLENKISEVRLTGSAGQEIFAANENGEVPILSNDKEKGTITKKGELILLNSFGKKVKLPFSFSYINKGQW